MTSNNTNANNTNTNNNGGNIDNTSNGVMAANAASAARLTNRSDNVIVNGSAVTGQELPGQANNAINNGVIVNGSAVNGQEPSGQVNNGVAARDDNAGIFQPLAPANRPIAQCNLGGGVLARDLRLGIFARDDYSNWATIPSRRRDPSRNNRRNGGISGGAGTGGVHSRNNRTGIFNPRDDE